jgi:glycosyltransferase involved in cell wall biosynthesis
MEEANPIQKTAGDGPLVSICIPAYQQADFIIETLESCLTQTYANIEIVVVDDCSPDDTVAKVEALAGTHPSIRLIRNATNQGVEKSWNLALSACKGDYIKLLCGDDLIAPECIARQVEALAQNPGVALVSCSRDIIDHRSRVVSSSRRKRFLSPTPLTSGLRIALRSGTNIIGEPACVLFRRSTEVFDARLPYLIDLDLWVKLWAHGALLILPQTLASFRIHPASLTSTIGLRHFHEYREFVKKMVLRHPDLIRWQDRWVASAKAFVLGWMRNLFLLLIRLRS